MKSFKQILFSLVLLLLSSQLLAQLPYNTTLTEDHYNNSNTVITKEGTVNWNGGGIRLGPTRSTAVGNWNDKYVVVALSQTSIPYQLTFKYKCNSVIATNPDWYVEESADNENWSRIWSAVTPTSSAVSVSTDTYTVDPIDLSKSTKYIKLCYSGNYSGTFTEISVSDQAYVNDPTVDNQVITSLDFGANSISSGVEEKSFDIEWCNVPALSVTSDNAFFTVSPASFGGKAKYGTQSITVGYNRDQEVGEHTATITVTNGSVTKTVTLSGSTTKREQAIHWNANLLATNFTLNAEEALTGAGIATADNEDAVLTYFSDNTDVIAVSQDGKTLYAGENGTATVTVTATGNDIYNEKIESQLFTVTSDKKQVILWDQNFMSLKTNADPNTIPLTATATSGGEVTYALEEGSDNCVSVSGSTLTITGTPGIAYIIASQAGGEINGEVWIAASLRKQIKVRDPQSACDEYALADESFTFAQGHKSTFAVQEYNLTGKPTQLTFTAKAGGKQYLWSEREPIYIDQYANFGSGLEWQQVTSITLDEDSKQYGPYSLNETATKIRFRSGDYSQQTVSNISVPRKKELLVSETSIVADAERNVRWAKTISVSRSNINVVDINVESSDPDSPFEVSKTSIGTDCSDRSTETFEVSITPREKNITYYGTVTITDGKANPTTHTIDLSITAVAFNQSILGFELPDSAMITDQITFSATATSGLEVIYLSSDSTVAYVENNSLVILGEGTVSITAYQAGNDRYNAAELTKTVVIYSEPVIIIPTTYGEFNAAVCDGDSVEFNGVWYTESVVDSVLLDLPNQFGGDSIVMLSITVNPVYSFADSLTIYRGAQQEWQGVDLSLLPAGDTTLVAAYTTVSGCDSVYTLGLTVLVPPTTYGNDTIRLCSGEKAEYEGKTYRRPTTDSVLLSQPNQFGGDSIVELVVYVFPAMRTSAELTITEGDSVLWQNIDLSVLPAGDTTLVAEYTTVNGCDSVYTLYLTVESVDKTDLEEIFESSNPQIFKFIKDGQLYLRREDKVYTIQGQKVK